MRKTLIVLVLLWGIGVHAQSKKSNWKEIEVYEFGNTPSLPDTLEICGGERFVKGEANDLGELSRAELKRIKKKVSKYGCEIVFVDTKQKGTSKKGKLYILGLKVKE